MGRKKSDEAETGREPAEKQGWLHFRTRADLTQRLDAHAAQLGVNRSEAARILLEAGLGETVENAVVKQAIYRLSGVIRRASAGLINDLARELPDQILRELEAEGGVLGPADGSGEHALHGVPDDVDAPDPADDDDVPLLPEG